MNKSIEAIVTFISAQMDGEPVPPTGSAALKSLETAIGELQKHRSDQELQILALHTMSAVIEKVGSNISAEQTLRNFIQPGGRS